jgi:hypothetical protein
MSFLNSGYLILARWFRCIPVTEANTVVFRCVLSVRISTRWNTVILFQSCNQWFTSHSSRYSGSQFIFRIYFRRVTIFQGNGPTRDRDAKNKQRNGPIVTVTVATIQVRTAYSSDSISLEDGLDQCNLPEYLVRCLFRNPSHPAYPSVDPINPIRRPSE